ncbi:putative nitrous oxide reductase, WD40/YVTN repeat-like-containing domain superfamily [Helianthus anomalus]
MIFVIFFNLIYNHALLFRYWDLRQANPVHYQQLPERCYALTVRHPLMVIGTADRNLIVFNLQNPQAGSIEGKVGVHHLDDQQQNKNFTFKCHREGNDI